MKISNLKYLFAISIIFVFAGCSKQLKQENPNAQTSASFWKTSTDALKGVNACYQMFLEDGGYMRFTPILLNIQGDDVRSNSPWTAISNVGRFQLGTSDEAGYGWTFDEYYQGIFRCNQVLENVPAISMDQNLKNRVLGQAYFLRGLYLFHLVDMFGSVPLPLKTSEVVKQATATEGWNQVINDLKAAADLLPVKYSDITGPDKTDIGRATKGAAMAFLGKAYLFNKKYTEASAQFKAVIDLGIYDLMPNYIDNFTDANENNKESIFEIQFSLNAGGTDLQWQGVPSSTWGFYSARAITFAAPNFGWRDVQPTFSLLNEYRQEKTTAGKIDPRCLVTIFYNDTVDTHLPNTPMYKTTFQATYASSPGYMADIYCKKYENGYGNKPDEYDWKSGINERIIRYADVLLMYAECQNELGNVAECAKYIQKVRTRAGLPDRIVEFSTYSQAQMRDQVAHERLLEFPLEGHRFDDIRRWGWLSDATKLAWLKSRDAEFNNYLPGRELLPIPQKEIDNNPGVKQNSTY
jgi:starch-binding outer membrane protein, SusD/RagB family